ncbi:endonuclease/exonuclease/phosphatase family protein [Halolactibacillus sp. JCM 19043]|uniref:endonuclease/exonuclease/phosphatase family protein n=1 Tax=Halolactibacillus sp. JCM 19043 TaxID=1460638 RepID=UPI000780739D|nr:endonuclease/exonuclease/phosphatase family protein [Halolactibacillus sp. JCM 19043]
MRLLTLNTHSYIEDNQQEKLDTLIKTIIANNYDVIALQEVNQLIDSPPVGETVIHEDNFARVIAEKLQAYGLTYSYHWAMAHIGYDRYEEGVAILTKHPVIDTSVITLTETTDKTYWKTRVAIKLTLDYHDQMIDCLSTHHGFWDDPDEPSQQQFDRLLTHIDASRPTFILGDFNTEAAVRKEGYDYLMSKGLYDTYTLAHDKDTGMTVPGVIDGWKHASGSKRIDYIFMNQPFSVPVSHVIFNDDNQPIVSDHFGVDVTVSLDI